jgi:hypothetical protein
MIHNKSGHPIEVKKISIRIWSLRDEIEAALGRRMKECEAAGVPLYIDDIKRFYNINSAQDSDNVLPLNANAQAGADGMTSLMESLGEADSSPAADADNLNQAEGIIAEQKMQGLETEKPNPILMRPYQRQAPDLDKISYGFTLLADVNMDTFLSFNKHKFLQGQTIVVEFLIPQSFLVTADVIYCNYYAMRSRIISPSKPDYRLQCRFIYLMPGERDNLRNFLKSVEPTIPAAKPKKKKENDVDDDLLGL